jgi:regulator of sirC expression with transglutaminase-like and TPR domain
LTCDPLSVPKNASGGFWYDAMACLCQLIDLNPSDQILRRSRAALLNQVGLHGVAEWDLRSLEAPPR